LLQRSTDFCENQIPKMSKIFVSGAVLLPHRTHDSREIHPLAYSIRQQWPGTEDDILPIAHAHITYPPLRASPPFSPSARTLLTNSSKNTTRRNSYLSTTLLAHCRMAASSPSHLPHQVSRDHTPHLHTFSHPHTPLNDIHNHHAGHTPGGGGEKTPKNLWRGWI
jgi:hypothetical protein